MVGKGGGGGCSVDLLPPPPPLALTPKAGNSRLSLTNEYPPTRKARTWKQSRRPLGVQALVLVVLLSAPAAQALGVLF